MVKLPESNLSVCLNNADVFFQTGSPSANGGDGIKGSFTQMISRQIDAEDSHDQSVCVMHGKLVQKHGKRDGNYDNGK